MPSLLVHTGQGVRVAPRARRDPALDDYLRCSLPVCRNPALDPEAVQRPTGWCVHARFVPELPLGHDSLVLGGSGHVEPGWVGSHFGRCGNIHKVRKLRRGAVSGGQ